MKILLEKHQKILNFGVLECPCCHSHDLIRWGFYERNSIHFENENQNCLESNIVKIQRVKCESCGRTHALLPFGIVPYKQFSLEVILKVLIKSTITSLEKISLFFSINISSIKNFVYEFKKKHLSKLFVMTNIHDVFKSLTEFENEITLRKQYIIKNNMCFMQNKLGYINLCPF